MSKYTLTSYEPVALELPKPQVPDSLVDAQIQKMLELLSTYHEVAEERGVLPGDFLVVTTHDPALDGNPARNFLMEHSIYHVGAGEMPKTFDDELVGVKPGETKQVRAAIKMPLGAQGGTSELTMGVDVEKILRCETPELTDELVAEHFAPATTVAEFRTGVAGQFGLPDMPRTTRASPTWCSPSWRSAWWRIRIRRTPCPACPTTPCASPAPSTPWPTTWTSSSTTTPSSPRCPAATSSSASRSTSS